MDCRIDIQAGIASMASIRFLAAAAGAALFAAGAAQAADLPYRSPPPAPPPPVFTWTGAYAGSNVGIGFLDARSDPACVNPGGVSFGVGCAVPPSFRLRKAGLIGGAQSGYNVQYNMFVVGIENDIQGASIEKSSTAAGAFPLIGGGFTPPGTVTAKERLSYFGTVRGRLGISFDRGLLYATGGLIYGDVEEGIDARFPAAGVAFVTSRERLRLGFTAGAGIEYAITDRLSIKAEGLYYDLGRKTLLTDSIPLPTGFRAGVRDRVTGEIARVGLNYHFGSFW
jgi:outer membrane immunogenic protein